MLDVCRPVLVDGPLLAYIHICGFTESVFVIELR